MSFLKDKKEGEFAETLIESFLNKQYQGCKIEKSVGKNSDWDGQLTPSKFSSEPSFTYEVKFDKMSADTGNLAFELGNQNGPSGLRISKADIIFYVLPNGDDYIIYKFNRSDLLNFIYQDNVRIVMGGDGKRFKLALVSIKNISIGEKFTWTLSQPLSKKPKQKKEKKES